MTPEAATPPLPDQVLRGLQVGLKDLKRMKEVVVGPGF
jgi:hypothetical protein